MLLRRSRQGPKVLDSLVGLFAGCTLSARDPTSGLASRLMPNALFKASSLTDNTVDPMIIVYTIKAAALLDLRLGTGHGTKRVYDFKYLENYLSMKPSPFIKAIKYKGNAALSRDTADALIH